MGERGLWGAINIRYSHPTKKTTKTQLLLPFSFIPHTFPRKGSKKPFYAKFPTIHFLRFPGYPLSDMEDPSHLLTWPTLHQKQATVMNRRALWGEQNILLMFRSPSPSPQSTRERHQHNRNRKCHSSDLVVASLLL